METPEFYHNSPFCSAAEKRQFSSENKTGDHFVVEEFLDFSNEEDNAAIAADAAAPGFDAVACAGSSADSVSVVDSSCNSSSFSGCDPNNFAAEIGCRSFADGQFSSDLCVPYDDIAEMEWLSNIVEESFSSEDLQRLQLISGIKALSAETTTNLQSPHHDHHDHDHHVVTSVPAKARSKRSRAPPCNWTSRLLLLSPSSSSSDTTASSASPESSDPDATAPAVGPKKGAKKKEEREGGGCGEGRKCLHCATDKTPQWRTGPMGPKTLCNACGVRYKSGRLVPEYRPAASPTFVLTKHSNSHRKVLELRRQKDFVRAQQHQQLIHHQSDNNDLNNDINGGLVFRHHQGHGHGHYHHAPSTSNGGEEFLIHHHVGPDFRQMI